MGPRKEHVQLVSCVRQGDNANVSNVFLVIENSFDNIKASFDFNNL